MAEKDGTRARTARRFAGVFRISNGRGKAMTEQKPEMSAMSVPGSNDEPEPYPDANVLYLAVGGSLFLMFTGFSFRDSVLSSPMFAVGYLVWLFGVPLALFFDAKKLCAGSRTRGRMFHVTTWGPWGWMIMEFLFAIIFLPLYALRRRRIYELNREEKDSR